MKKKLFSLLIAGSISTLIGCNDNEAPKAASFSSGLYKSSCQEDTENNMSTNLVLNFKEGVATKINVSLYLSNSICDGNPDETNQEQVGVASFSGAILAPQISYLTFVADGGAPVYTPFYIEGSHLYMGSDSNTIGKTLEENQKIFADFIANPKTGSLLFNRVADYMPEQ